MWLVRAGRGAEFIDAFVEQGVVGLCFDDGSRLPANPTRDQILERVTLASPGDKKAAVQVRAAQQARFVLDFQNGDLVLTYDPETRDYLLGEISSGYVFLKDAGTDYCHARRVTWKHRASRDELAVETRNTLGAIQTVILVNEAAAKDVIAHARPFTAVDRSPAPAGKTVNTAPDDEWFREQIAKADQFVEDRIHRLDWQEMQELVAGLLRAMGYKTRVSPPGPDRGLDIFASPDGIGLEEPRIFVEVKHRTTTAIGSREIRSFLGGRKAGDKCLFVSTGGYSKDARLEADRSHVAITLLGLPELRKLVVEYYEKLDPTVAKLVPLQRVYLPVG
ncbi:MAG: restriction endonuclease [Polyangiaceae bacterium]